MAKLPGELTWPKLIGTSLAAVTAAWVAGRLNYGGALTGAAIGSAVATIAAAFFTTTIDKSKTIIVRTDRGTVIESAAVEDVVDEESGESLMPDDSHGTEPARAESGESRWRRIHWKSVAVAAALTLAITLFAITIYESAVGRTWGSDEPGTSIGNTVRGGPQTPAPAPTATETATPEATEPTESATPEATPTPTDTPTSSPTPTECVSPTTSPSPTPGQPAPPPAPCPTPTDTEAPGQADPLLP